MSKPIELTLAHSPDPDDAFMWWPITGKVSPSGEPLAGRAGKPVLDTGPFRFQAIPADIERLNRRAIAPAKGETPYDITAVSFRAYADAAREYVLTACGSSFGLGFGPKVVARQDQAGDAITIGCERCLKKQGVRIAIPGLKTTAFMVLGLMLGPEAVAQRERFIEMPFGDVIPAVARREVEAGLVIHEGQVTFRDAGLVPVVDLGEWWQRKHGLPLPLGGNAVRRDLDARFGSGTIAEVSRWLRRSIDHAIEHREESIEYTMPFALANAVGDHRGTPTTQRVDDYVKMYVNDLTVDMGERGRHALERLYRDGHVAGLCPQVARVELV